MRPSSGPGWRGAGVILTAVGAWTLAAVPARAEVRVSSICRVKGQEVNKIHGIGLVLGLNGTGDGAKFGPMIRGLASALDHFNVRALSRAELAKTKNVALVVVSATIPPTGARQGDQFDVHVVSMGSCKSLKGGRLFWTPLQGPQKDAKAVLAYAEGPVSIDDPDNPTSGRVVKGGVLEAEFLNLYKIEDTQTGEQYFTLVLENSHASFQAASEIASRINSHEQLRTGLKEVARALDPKNVRVLIPKADRDDPVPYIASILNLGLRLVTSRPKVIINERTGTVIIDGNVEISPVVITHKNLTVILSRPAPATPEAPPAPPETGTVVKLEHEAQGGINLQDLVDALNRLKIETADLIEIIRELDASGNLHAWLEWR